MLSYIKSINSKQFVLEGRNKTGKAQLQDSVLCRIEQYRQTTNLKLNNLLYMQDNIEQMLAVIEQKTTEIEKRMDKSNSDQTTLLTITKGLIELVKELIANTKA